MKNHEASAKYWYNAMMDDDNEDWQMAGEEMMADLGTLAEGPDALKELVDEFMLELSRGNVRRCVVEV